MSFKKATRIDSKSPKSCHSLTIYVINPFEFNEAVKARYVLFPTSYFNTLFLNGKEKEEST